MNSDSTIAGSPSICDVGVARERLLDQHLQLQARERGAEAEVPSARAERLVLGFAAQVEAVGVLVARLVAVGGDVPHHHLLALLDLLAVQLGVARRRAAEVRERREHPQRLLDRVGHQRGVLQQQPLLLGVFHQRAHAAAVGRLRRVVARRHQQEEAHHDLVLLELLAVDLRMHEHARQVLGRVLTAVRRSACGSARRSPGCLSRQRLRARRG